MDTLERFAGRLVSVIHNLAALLLALASALVFYQVVTRFVIGHSATWTEVLARAVIIWMVFLVSGPALYLGRMIPIDVIREVMPKRVQLWLIRFVTAAIATVLLVLIWYGYKMTLRVMDQQVAMIGISVAWFYAAVPIGSALALFGLILSHLDAERGHIGQLDEGDHGEAIE